MTWAAETSEKGEIQKTSQVRIRLNYLDIYITNERIKDKYIVQNHYSNSSANSLK